MRWQVRGGIAAAVGAGLVLLWWGVFSLWPRLAIGIVRPDENCDDIGCAIGAALVSLIFTVALVVSLSMIIGWVVLHAVDVRPAWPAAMFGPVVGWLIGAVANPVLPDHLILKLIAPIALAYGLIAIASTPRNA